MGTASEELFLDNQFDVFPNPTNGFFTVLAKDITGKTELKLLDMFGRQVWQSEWDINTESEKVVEIADLFKGIYWVVLCKEEVITTKQIVFQ